MEALSANYEHYVAIQNNEINRLHASIDMLEAKHNDRLCQLMNASEVEFDFDLNEYAIERVDLENRFSHELTIHFIHKETFHERELTFCDEELYGFMKEIKRALEVMKSVERDIDKAREEYEELMAQRRSATYLAYLRSGLIAP